MINLEMVNQINIYLEEMYEAGTTIEAGRNLSNIGLKTSQIRGLETLIASTTRFSEIANYIKNQAGKERNLPKWRNIAPELLRQLDQIEVRANAIAGGDFSAKMEVKLRIVRGWARQIVAHYLYGAIRGN